MLVGTSRIRNGAIPDILRFVRAWPWTSRQIAVSYFWSILIWMGWTPFMAGQDKVRLLERGVNTPYLYLLLANGGWLLTAAILTPPIFFIVSRYPIAKHAEPVKRAAGYLLGGLPYLLCSLCVRWVVLPPWDSQAQQFGPRTLQSFLANADVFALQVWDYLVIVVAAHAYAYFKRATQKEVEHAELQQALAASELQALKSQLQPHFLFNTLHGISTLLDGDKARAKSMILQLSNLLRANLQYGSSDMVALEEEAKFTAAYLDIEKMRLDGRLEVRWNIRPETLGLLVPQLILQPLAENAILHGIACSREGGWLEIASQALEGRLELTVRNSVRGKSQSGMGFGLQNSQARLKYLYLDEATLSFGIGEDGVAEARLLLPALVASNP